MNLRRAGIEVLASVLAALSFPAGSPAGAPARVRKFDFYYQVILKDLPADASTVRLWLPFPSSDAHQAVVVKKLTGPVRLRETVERRYGNRMMYAEWRPLKSSDATFTLHYEVTRWEFARGDYQSLMKNNRPDDPPPEAVARYLRADRLVPVGGKLQRLAEEQTRGQTGPVEKAHTLYNYVFHTMRYDKSGTGWGRGDALWACDAKHGNCTDFHSLFISLARGVGIPARFKIGFPLPEDAHQGIVPGYHCWAEFYVDGTGWVPVDISEAWQHPGRHDYFFGSVDANRVRFSLGRDLTLVPKQNGSPLNYFVYPYAEVNGRPFEKMEKKFWFKDEE